MLRLYGKLILNVCCKCKTTQSLTLYKSTLAKQESEHVLKNQTSNFSYDALDVFTNSIILENMSKWKTDNFSMSEVSKSKTSSISKHCDDPEYLVTYLQQCLDGYCSVSESVLTHFMLTMVKHGQINGLVLVEKLIAKYNYSIKKSELQMNFAEAYWTNGNLDCMFQIFETFYPTESMKVNYVLEPIIHTIVKTRGIASVVMVLNFVNIIVTKYRDHQPMSILWKCLFLSELYDDNLEAEKLMQQNSNLIVYIQYLIPTMTNSLLKKHKIDYVRRLMTVLLKYKQIKSYQWVLRSLFGYYCKYLLYLLWSILMI